MRRKHVGSLSDISRFVWVKIFEYIKLLVCIENNHMCTLHLLFTKILAKWISLEHSNTIYIWIEFKYGGSFHLNLNLLCWYIGMYHFIQTQRQKYIYKSRQILIIIYSNIFFVLIPLQGLFLSSRVLSRDVAIVRACVALLLLVVQTILGNQPVTGNPGPVAWAPLSLLRLVTARLWAFLSLAAAKRTASCMISNIRS